jgi:hypothetical protein
MLYSWTVFANVMNWATSPSGLNIRPIGIVEIHYAWRASSIIPRKPPIPSVIQFE